MEGFAPVRSTPEEPAVKRRDSVLRVLCATLACLAVVATGWTAETPSAQVLAKNPFFALCFDTHDAQKRSLAEQSQMLAELGYDGAAHLWLDNVPERLETLDRNGLKLYQVYARLNIDPAQAKFNPKLPEVIRLLRGRPTILGLLIKGGKPSDPSGDDRAVVILREVAAMAAASGIRVALYPHTGDWIAKTSDAVRVVKKVDRPNVGVMFNLCHALKVEGARGLDTTLRQAAPYLFVVTINGADPPPGNWDRLIQPLGRGSFDVAGLLATLGELGYTGPIGLQCYGIRGDARVHLRQSMAAWKELTRPKPAKTK